MTSPMADSGSTQGLERATEGGCSDDGGEHRDAGEDAHLSAMLSSDAFKLRNRRGEGGEGTESAQADDE